MAQVEFMLAVDYGKATLHDSYYLLSNKSKVYVKYSTSSTKSVKIDRIEGNHAFFNVELGRRKIELSIKIKKDFANKIKFLHSINHPGVLYTFYLKSYGVLGFDSLESKQLMFSIAFKNRILNISSDLLDRLPSNLSGNKANLDIYQICLKGSPLNLKKDDFIKAIETLFNDYGSPKK